MESLGDEEIFIGEETNVQDLSMMHVPRLRTMCSSAWAPSS
jgi:carbonic anhydrase/acetyltransferase-like protein (isoleucine patch superfamily)